MREIYEKKSSSGIALFISCIFACTFFLALLFCGRSFLHFLLHSFLVKVVDFLQQQLTTYTTEEISISHTNFNCT